MLRQATVGRAVALLPDKVEVLFRGDACVHHDEHLLVVRRIGRVIRYQLVHHVGQRLGVGSVSFQYRTVADEAVGVDAQGEHQQLAVAPLLLGMPELGLRAAVLAPLEIEVGQVEEHDAVRGPEQVVRHMAEVFLYPCLLLQEPVGHAVHLTVLDVLQGKVHQPANGGVPLHDAHRAKLKRLRVNHAAGLLLAVLYGIMDEVEFVLFH